MIIGGSVISPILQIINSYLQHSTANKWTYPAMLSIESCQVAINLPCQSQTLLKRIQHDGFFTLKTGGFVYKRVWVNIQRPTPFLSQAPSLSVYSIYDLTFGLLAGLAVFSVSNPVKNLVLLHNHFPCSYVEKEHCMVPNIWFSNPLRSHGFWRELI